MTDQKQVDRLAQIRSAKGALAPEKYPFREDDEEIAVRCGVAVEIFRAIHAQFDALLALLEESRVAMVRTLVGAMADALAHHRGEIADSPLSAEAKEEVITRLALRLMDLGDSEPVNDFENHGTGIYCAKAPVVCAVKVDDAMADTR